MNNIIIDDGKRRYSINGDENRVIEFDAGDMNIVIRAEEAQKQIQEALSSMPETDEYNYVESLKVIDEKVRQSIDYIFNSDVSNVVFGKTSPLALKNGKTFAERFIEAVMPWIEKEVAAEQKKTEKRLGKHISKYSG